jgi:hypothetical protein
LTTFFADTPRTLCAFSTSTKYATRCSGLNILDHSCCKRRLRQVKCPALDSAPS